MRSTPDDYRSIALRAAKDFDQTVRYLRSGRAEDALLVASRAADALRFELSHRRKPPHARNARRGQPATALPS